MPFHLTEDTIIYAQYKPHSVTHRSVTSGRKITVRFRPLQKLGGVTKSSVLLGLLLPSVLPGFRFFTNPQNFPQHKQVWTFWLFWIVYKILTILTNGIKYQFWHRKIAGKHEQIFSSKCQSKLLISSKTFYHNSRKNASNLFFKNRKYFYGRTVIIYQLIDWQYLILNCYIIPISEQKKTSPEAG